MKKFLILSLLLFTPAFAIDWVNIESKNNNVLYLDKDSITQHKNYYFYNIKTIKENGEEVIITLQSQKSHPFCARIKYYTPQNYNSLNGIDMIDKFKLEQHGIKPIIEHNNQYVHFINGRQYNLYKKDSNYYMITESSKGFKSYKLTIHDEPITLTLESLYGRK